MTAVEVATVSYTVSADYFAEVGADFDSEAVDDAVPEVAAAAREIDWKALLERIDVDQILATHGR
jgi:hypothetical protein